MMHLFISICLSFVVIFASAHVTKVALKLALRRSVLDLPTNRSSHTVPTPRAGGVSIVVVFLTAVLVLAGLHQLSGAMVFALLAGSLIALVGGWDDLMNLPAPLRFAVHCVACAAAVLGLAGHQGLRLGTAIPMNALVWVPLLTLAFVWLVNLTNFMDGIDGLAGTEAVTVGALCCVLSISSHGSNAPAILFAVLALSSLGFLLWNWYPAAIFMGDIGSGFLGFCFGALTLLAAKQHVLSPIAPILLLGVFVVDASFTLARRMAKGERWYAPHRSHGYQHLAQRLGHERTTTLVAAVNVLWLGPWAFAATRFPASALLCLIAAWAPLVLAAAWLRAGEAQERGVHPQRGWPTDGRGTPVLGATMLARTSASTVARLYRLTEKHGYATKHLGLTVLNYACVYLALLTRFDGSIPQPWLSQWPRIALTWCLVQEIVLLLFRAGRSHWRFTAAEELPAIGGTAALASVVGGITVAFLPPHIVAIPRSVFLLDAIYSVAVLACARLLSRNLFVFVRRARRENARVRVLIHGADEVGVGVLAEIRHRCLDYKAVGFLDARASVQGATISGVPVLGRETDLPKLAKKHKIDLVIVPSERDPIAANNSVRQICLEHKLDFRVVSSLSTETGLRRPSSTADLVIEDLLGRKPVQLDTDSIAEELEGRVVMVTGAAGSIGSELCRQIARFRPRAIIGYEISETALFYMERQMQELFPDVGFVPCIGSVQNRSRLDDVLLTYQPHVVYHAAAYKHVPLMEQHIFEAIENNIFGTEAVLRACEAHGVRRFVMISTDKAARPTSLMGVTKRVAEMLVRASLSADLTCVSTRFGNVLGSNGSVIPIFLDQIAKGGPVKVTHPDMVRYFMTIPEAAQLVLQASSLGAANEIFVLDMGEPVKVIDLAEKMIRLSGLTPGKDMEIVFTGMRPGEKLVEELSTPYEELLPTAHRSISVFRSGATLSHRELYHELNLLRIALEERSAQDALTILNRLVPDYTASREIRNLSAGQVPALRPALSVA